MYQLTSQSSNVRRDFAGVLEVSPDCVSMDHRPFGSYGAALTSFERDAGHYRDDPTSNFTVVMLQNGGYAAEFDLGVGRFAVKSAPGQLFLFRPLITIDSTFYGTAKLLMLSVTRSALSRLLPALDLQSELRFRDLYARPLRDELIRIAITQLWAATRARRDSDLLFADTVVLAIFAALARYDERPCVAIERGLADWQLRRVMEMLESMQDVPLADLAARANMSPWYFARAFKHTTGVPPHHFQFVMRMNCAKDLLAKTTLPITTVAERVGYGSSQTLARAFRKEVGISPLQYRRTSTA
jgi:AraC family transcriptional regulator